MVRPTPVVPRDWLRRASLLGAAMLVLSGALVLASWGRWIDWLGEGQPDSALMPPDLALGLVTLGIVLLALEANLRRAVWLALVPAAIGLAAFAQDVSSWASPVNEFLEHGRAAVDAAGGTGMSRLQALSLFTSGLCLLGMGLPSLARRRSLVTALVSSLVISVGLAPLVGLLVGLSPASAGSPAAPPVPLGGLCLVLLGHLLLSRVWRDDPERSSGLPNWLPVPVMAAGATLTLLSADALRDREQAFVRTTTQLTINNAATVLNFELDNQAKALQRLATRWAQTDRLTDAMRDRDGRAYQEDFPALRSLTWVDAAHHTRWFFPAEGNEHLLQYDHDKDALRRALIVRAERTGRPAFSPLLTLPLGGRGFFICAPLAAAAEPRAEVLLGEFVYPLLLESVEKRLQLSALYAVAFDVDGQRVFTRDPASPVRNDLREESVFNLFDQRIRISLAPSEFALQRSRQLFPELITALGLGLSVLLGAVVNLAHTALVRGRAAEQANRRLVAENEERRRAEEALRASQAATRKLSMVASSTDNLVVIADAAGRLEWINNSFMRLLGYDLAEAAGRPLTQLLVGPDTDPATVARLHEALKHARPFSADLVCHAHDGRRCHLHLDLQPVRNEAEVVENVIAILTDITTRVETEHHLRTAKEEADAASRAKSEFLASMSHEIRTPLNGVLGMTSLLTGTPLSSEQRECVQTILTSGNALLAIINDILDFSNIESGRLELADHPFELSGCVEEALDGFAERAAAKRIALAYCIDPAVPAWITGDAGRLRQIMVNLLNNAVKFTPHGQVSVEVRPAGDAPGFIAIAVRDTGIGIPAQKLGLLFRPFSQADSSTTRKYGGTGLGLVISHRLCELMGGRFRVESEPGRGSVFTFTVPARPVAPASHPPFAMIPARLQGGAVVAVDDHAANCAFLTTVLAGAGIVCHAVDSLAAARALAGPAAAPVLLIVDRMRSSGEDGPQIQALRQHWRQPALPVLFLQPAGELAPAALLEEFAPAHQLTKPLKQTPFLLTVRSFFVTPGSRFPGVHPAESRPSAAPGVTRV